MEKKDIERINALARKAKSPEGLTAQERAEQAHLRRRYIDAVKADLDRQLDNTYLVDEQGRKRRLKRKGGA